MNHHPFKEWLVAEGELSTEQDQALKQHLLDCDSCRELQTSWKELEVEIKRAAQIAPSAGFVVRWQANLVMHQQLQQKRRGWITIGATTTLVISLLVLLLLQIWALIQAPDAFLAVWFDRLVVVISVFYSVQNLAHSFSLPGPVYTLVGMVLLFGLISFMSVLWLATYRKFSMARREA